MKRSLSLEEQLDIEQEKNAEAAARIAAFGNMTEAEYAKAIKQFEKDQGVNKARLPVYTTKNPRIEAEKLVRLNRIVDALEEHGAMSRGELSEALKCNLTSVPDYIKPLVTDGTVTKTTPDGNNVIKYILTEEL